MSASPAIGKTLLLGVSGGANRTLAACRCLLVALPSVVGDGGASVSRPRALLRLLQLGDSFFPSGANVFSNGLEGLARSGRVCDARDVSRFVAVQLEHRWSRADRLALLHAYGCAFDLTALERVDTFVDASTPVESVRLGGRRLGRSLLRTHGELATPLTEEYATRVRDGAPGQASVVQGLVGAALGLSADEAAVLSAYGVALGLVSAALRLGLIGHLDAQRIVSDQAERSEALIALPLPALGEYGAFVPEGEIACMRQETRRDRLFAS